MSPSRVCYLVYSMPIHIDSLYPESLSDVYFINSFSSSTLDGSASVLVDYAIMKSRSHSWLLSELYGSMPPSSPLPLIFHSPDVAFNYALGVIDFSEALFQDFTLSFPLVSPVSKTMSPSDSITI